MSSTSTSTLNPWLSIWTQPRATIREIVDTAPKRLNVLLVGIAGITMLLDQFSDANMGDRLSLPVMFLIAAIAGPVVSLVGWYIYAALVKWTGNWIGGAGNAVHIRSAMAWSYVPYVLLALLWLVKLMVFGSDLFTEETPNLAGNVMLAYGLIGVAALQLVVLVWYFVIYLKTLAEVQGFSVWKALANSLLAVLVVLVPIVVLVVIVSAVTG